MPKIPLELRHGLAGGCANCAAADALFEVVQRISRRISPVTNGEPDFIIDPQDLAELDDALRQYREATNG